MIKLEKEYQLALKAAVTASKVIMEVYKHDVKPNIKKDGSPVTKADLASSKIIKNALSETNIPITGEELIKTPYSDRKKWKKSWCVDPLDGTKEFLKKNGEFVVNIALIENDKPIFGIIASPVAERIIVGGTAIDGAFYLAFDNIQKPEKWERLSQLDQVNNPPVVISSRSHYSGDLLNLIKKIETTFGELASAQMGSALKFFDLVKGKADIYPRFAPTMEWDIAAGQAIYEVLGGEILSLKTGLPLTYNKEDLRNNFFIARKKIMNFSFENLV